MPEIPNLNGGVAPTTPLNDSDLLIIEQDGVTKPGTVAMLTEHAALEVGPSIASAGVSRGQENPGPYSLAGLLEAEAETFTGTHFLQWQDDGSTFYVGTRYLSSDVLQVDRYTAAAPWSLEGAVLLSNGLFAWAEPDNGVFRVLENAYYDVHGSDPKIITRIPLDTPWDTADPGAGAAADLPADILSFVVSPDETTLLLLRSGFGDLGLLVEQHSFGTPGDISTLTYGGAWFLGAAPVHAGTYLPVLDVSPDGLHLIVSGPDSDTLTGEPCVIAYRLAAAWDVVGTAPTLRRQLRPYGAQPSRNASNSRFERCYAVWGDDGFSLYLFGLPGYTVATGVGQPHDYRRLIVGPRIVGGALVFRGADGTDYEMTESA